MKKNTHTMGPGEYHAFYYQKVREIRIYFRIYLNIFPLGMGDPVMAVPTLVAMTSLQTLITGRCTGSNSLNIFGIWLISTTCANYAGALIGGALMEFLTYEYAAYLLCIVCSMGLVISVGMRNFMEKYERDSAYLPLFPDKVEELYSDEQSYD